MSQASHRALSWLVPRDRRRAVVEHLAPQIDGGRFPIKRTVGEPVEVEADAFADGHDTLRVVLRYRRLGESGADWIELPMKPLGNDRWRAEFSPGGTGYAEYTVAAWVDHFASWRRELQIKFEAGDPVGSELLEGADLLRRAAATLQPASPHRGSAAERQQAVERLLAWASAISTPAPDAARVDMALSPALASDMDAWAPPVDEVSHEPVPVRVEDRRAAFGAWYEMFPRSAGATGHPEGASFNEAGNRLGDIAAMGFDVVYLPPIHPIGRTARKGPNNQPSTSPADPGSPWAIGSEEGGHKSVHPHLGTIEDFDRFVEVARRLGLDVALDIAFQCSPDHPYVKQHPEWFRHRPDGSIKYAENPPKKYQDIYPLDFESPAWESLWHELKSVVLFWVDHGIRTFRIDNPHTKPFRFWEWLIAEVQRQHPDTVFLSEAFTRPKLMRHLARAGFTQSYTYFTWRNTKAELTEYFTELTQTELREYLRPNLFTNTPDILHAYLQDGGPPAFETRLLLAATLGQLYGIYSGFELCENKAIRAGSEEYLDSEKYQIRVRDFRAPGTLQPLIAQLNAIRRSHAAFQPGSRLRFHPTDNDAIICYSRESADGRDRMLIVVNLDPHAMQHGWIDLPVSEWGLDREPEYVVHDELGGERYHWRGATSYVRLEPGVRQGHILHVPSAEEVRA